MTMLSRAVNWRSPQLRAFSAPTGGAPETKTILSEDGSCIISLRSGAGALFPAG